MTADDTRPDLPAVLSAVAIRAYVNAAGWTEGPQGSRGSVFERDGFKVSVPHEDDDPDAIRMALYRLASAEGRVPEATAAAIAAHRDAGTATKDCGCGPLEPCGEHLEAGSPGVTRWRRRTPELGVMHWDGSASGATAIIDWILANDGTARYHDDPARLRIDLPRGTVDALPGDRIIKAEDGTFRPLDEPGFFSLLEPVGVLVSADVTSPAPALAGCSGTATGPAEGSDEATTEPHMLLLEMAFGIIANAGWDAFSGNVDLPKTTGWHEAAIRWRDDYHGWLDLHSRPGGWQSWEELATSLCRERDALFAETERLKRDLRDATSGTAAEIVREEQRHG